MSGEVFVVVSIADNGVVHAWGDGTVLEPGRPYGSRREAMNARDRARREFDRRQRSGEIEAGSITLHVCKVLGSETASEAIS